MNCIFCHRPTIMPNPTGRRCALCNVGYTLEQDQTIGTIVIDHLPWPMIIFIKQNNIEYNIIEIFDDQYKFICRTNLEWIFPQNLKQFHARIDKLKAFL